MKHVIAVVFALFGLYAVAAPAEAGGFTPLEKRGCCSHHSGVCGCVNGNVKCCDGSFSPTCGC